jgi:YHS domain-containing protein
MKVVKDPVCGMVFVKEDAAGQTLYKGETYYFCAPSCKKSFDSDLQKYLAAFNDIQSSKGSNEINFGEDERNEKDNSLREHN